ncbi:MAG: MG2 domain-containing protein [Pseudobdellovibrionaceae bacterium]
MKKIILILLTSFLFAPAFAKSLYLTVRRDFSSKEEPQIEINYSRTEPILLRVLVPKDQKAFIASQIDLRRSWREPKSQFNPAYFLLQGQNNEELTTDWMRLGVDSEVRDGLRDKVGGAYEEGGKARLSPGVKKMISAPEGFTVFTEITINPEGEDKKDPFDVPGFNSYFGRESSLQTKIIKLPKLPNGFFVVQALQQNLEGQVVLVINDLIAQLQHSNGDLLYRVANREGQPVASANIEVRNLNGKWISKGATDENGEVQLKSGNDTELVSVVNSPLGTAIIDSEYYSTTAVFPDVYLYTDRPMYRSGNEVHFRGILRNLEKGVSLTGKEAKAVTVELQSLDGTTVQKSIQVKVTPFGTFSGKLSLDENVEGVFRVVAAVSKVSHSGEIRVKEYVKPLYFVDVKSEKETLKAGDLLKGELKAERYAGGAPAIVKASAELYRVRMSAPQWAEDAGMGEIGSTVTYGFSQDQEGSSMLPVLIGSIESIEFSNEGKAEFELQLPAEIPGPKNYDYKFILKFTFVDADNNIVTASKTYFDLAAEVVAQAKFNRVVAAKSADAQLVVRSVSASGIVMPVVPGQVEFILIDGKGTRTLIEKKSFKTNAKGVLQAAIPTSLEGKSGELIAVVTLFDAKKNKAVTEASVILAGADKGSAVIPLSEARILSNQFVLSANDKARMFLMLPPGWGEKGSNRGKLYLTIAGSKVYSRKIIPVDGLSTWIEEALLPEFGTAVYLVLSYPHSKEGWIERRSTFRIVDTSKSLKVTIKPDFEMASPGGKQGLTILVKDAAGKPVKAEVSISVVDRSVLDLQPEIRPSLLDFFYPQTKLNLMTFLSSQFQSYGYGEEIARLFQANFKMAAAKTQSKVLDQEDTAYWNGSVVTDEKGTGKIRFELPGNQTIWRVTSVAVDNLGRFGEGTKEFKSQSPVSLLLGYPSFIRKNDKSQVLKRKNLHRPEYKR